MIRSALFTLFIIMLTVSLLVIPVTAIPAYQWTRSITLYAPAVTENEQGVLSEVKLTIAYPGKGYVYFSAFPLTELDTQATARVAAMVATSIAGKDFYSYDYYVVMESSSMIVGGPSAGGLMTVGFLALLLNATVFNNVTMTGMINPDGTIGPVGGLKGKLEAVAAHGFKEFLIPLGQRIVLEPNVTVKRYPWGIYKTVTYVKTDLVKYGEQLGVKVIEVASIREAFKYFTGIDLSRNISITNIKLPETLCNEFKKQAELFISNATIYINEALNSLPKVPAIYRTDVSSLIRSVNQTRNLAELYLENNTIFLATNTGFKAAYQSMYVAWLTHYLAKDKDLNELINQVNQTLIKASEAINKTIKNVPEMTLQDLDIFIGAYSRLIDAQRSYTEANRSLTQNDIISAIDNYVYTYWRALSVILWLKQLGTTGTSLGIEEKTVSQDKLERAALIIFGIADSTTSYAYTLAKDIGATSDDLSLAMQYLDIAREELGLNNTIGVLGESIYATVYSTVAIHNLFISNQSILPMLTEHVMKEAAYTIKDLENTGAISLLPLYYYIYGYELYQAGRYSDALDIFIMSILQAKKNLLLVLNKTQENTKNTTTTEVPIKTTTITITQTNTTTVTKTTTTTHTSTATTTLERTHHITLEGVLIGLFIGIIAMSIITILLLRPKHSETYP